MSAYKYNDFRYSIRVHFPDVRSIYNTADQPANFENTPGRPF